MIVVIISATFSSCSLATHNDFFFYFKFYVVVNFYGREESPHVKLPIKTDQDTLREGYR